MERGERIVEFTSVKAFLVEMLVFLFITAFVFVCLLACGWVEIIIHTNLLTITAIGFVLISFVSLFSKIVPIGVRATFDFLFQSVQEDTYIFLRTQPLRASVFTEKFTSDGGRSYGMYYLIQTQRENEIHTFISPCYIDLVENEVYVIKSGRTSNVFLSGVCLTNLTEKKTH